MRPASRWSSQFESRAGITTESRISLPDIRRDDPVFILRRHYGSSGCRTGQILLALDPVALLLERFNVMLFTALHLPLEKAQGVDAAWIPTKDQLRYAPCAEARPAAL